VRLRTRLVVTTLAFMVPLVSAVATAHWLAARGTFAPVVAATSERLSVHRSLPLFVHAVSIALALVAVVLGIGPIVRRTRALTLAVRRWQGDEAHPMPLDPSLDELGELSRAFRTATESVAARKRDVREFVENVSHDLATPLTVLQGHLTALATNPSAEICREAMNEAQYMSSLLGSLAVIGKFETGAIVGETLDLAELTSRVVARHRSLAARLQVSLECAVPGEPVLARGDVTFAEQAIANLVGNAIRHNQPTGHAAVVLDIDGQEFTLRVLDDGPGLSEAERARLRERGARGDQARSRDPNGRGLGLSIVTRVAAVHGWLFTLAQNQPQGLCAELRGVRCLAIADGDA
jgi:signal transduction histidine kinase